MVAIFNKKINFILFVFVFISRLTFGQVGNWNFEHFSYQDGLASNEIFSMIQDEEGYIWIATSEGLNRYNGSSFKQYKHDPLDSCSISDGEIVGMLETSQFIWMGASGGVLNKYDKKTGKFQTYPIKHKEEKWNHLIWDIVAEGDSVLWLAMERGLCKFHITSGKSKVFLPTTIKPELYSDIQYDVFYCLEQNHSNGNELFVGGRGGLLVFEKKKEKFSINPWYDKKHSIKDIYQDGDSLIWLAGTGSQVKINPKLRSFQKYTFQDKTKTSISCNFIRRINDDEYWVGFFEYGPAILNKENGEYSFMAHLPEIYRDFPKSNCISFLKTREGSIWFGTDKGIFIQNKSAEKFRHYHIRKPNVKYSFFHFIGDIIELKDKEAYLVIPSIDQLPLLIDKKSGDIIKKFKLSKNVKKKLKNFNFHKVKQDSKGVFWLSSTNGLYCLNMTTYEVELPKLKTEYDFSRHNLFYIEIDQDDNIFMTSNNPMGLVKINGERDEVFSYYHFFEEKEIVGISDLILIQNEQLILFSDPMISSFNIKDTTFKLLNCPNYSDLLFQGWIRCGLLDNENIWVGYQGNGISIIEGWDGDCRIENFKKSKGLNSNQFYEFEKDAKGNIWAATGNGISMIDPHTMESINFSQKDGLLENNTGIYWTSSFKILDSGDLFLGGHSFFTIFNPDSILNHSSEHFTPVFEEFLVYEQQKSFDLVINRKEEIDLEYNENFFSIEFANLSYSNILPTEYKYKLEAYDDDWVTTSSNRVQYKKVPPGKYRFRLSHANENISNKEISFIINIIPAWWQTRLFKILMAFLIIGVLFFIQNRRAVYIRKREKLKATYDKKLLETEMKMLQSQLNSHFLFNSLNSIKNYIIKNETTLAASYLSNFAQLIRVVLNNSQHKSISLSSELEALELYISLEALRFKDKFDYMINTKEGIDIENIKVPPLLLQPFVENAIWHGLLHQEKKGMISIEIISKSNKIIYTIIDNGIGRKKARELKSKSAIQKKTFGLRLSTERLETLKKMYDIDISLQIDDLSDKEGKAAGTSVKISFPSHKDLS